MSSNPPRYEVLCAGPCNGLRRRYSSGPSRAATRVTVPTLDVQTTSCAQVAPHLDCDAALTPGSYAMRMPRAKIN